MFWLWLKVTMKRFKRFFVLGCRIFTASVAWSPPAFRFWTMSSGLVDLCNPLIMTRIGRVCLFEKEYHSTWFSLSHCDVALYSSSFFGFNLKWPAWYIVLIDNLKLFSFMNLVSSLSKLSSPF